ncbi:M1 family metallopeptidase [Phaeocystidibacter marisrubri]|uniref:Aminopeptidase N n=1 Tax=Phaeocystidibacter marisrubri TaxID=1577780 RepID=A0A6L3ZE97_9FLAO|nr:M1 family metallopeptidase [Phaeocystidibacter marisrubri]KAB2816155.1 M1 family metallopeptidase [Phaeocystidibacter marisrubri]GGH67608.1 aminopeptidase [Phaeocystidibacter marisrubri]
MKKLAILAAVALVGCQSNESQPSESEETTMKYANDIHSFSKPNEAAVKHLDIFLDVNFDTKIITGVADWTIESAEGATEIIFDTYHLGIESVSTDDGGQVDFSMSDEDEILGSALHIPITNETKHVVINYETSSDAKALQWLDPEQTSSKTAPFLLTQSQAILARTWLPCQDGPGIRFTYKAEVKVPENLMPVMSAGGNPTELHPDGSYNFEMPQAIPSYLMALAVGDIEFRAIGENTGVYAEPTIVDTAAWEFADIDAMISAAEDLYGPYAWGRYDIIVLPASFPFGGMENPRITFATPTILAGDRSLVSLVAHELAHSWSGNLVTNATWNDFWLNEGFTVYFEQRIMESVYGREYSEMLASLAHEGLKDEVAEFMHGHAEDTKLAIDLTDRNPDDGVTTIAYDKGYHFLRLIEQTVGRDRFDAFLKNYFTSHAFQVMTTEEFVNLLESDLLTPEEVKEIGVQEWIYGTGLPENCPVPNAVRFEKVDAAASLFKTEGTLPTSEEAAAWSSHEWMRFIQELGELSVDQLTALDNAFHFSKSGNSEILAAWFQPTIRAGYEPVRPVVEDFLIHVGRRKFLTPTYKAMLESDKSEWAKEVYQKARPNYHAVARETMDDLLDYQMAE